MKSFALLLGASLSDAKVHIGGCPKPDVVQDFDMSRYDGQWYEIATSPDNVLESGWSCVSESYTSKNNGFYDIHTPYIKDGKPHLWAKGQEMVCPGTDGHCVVNFKGQPDPNASSNYKIVATDYENYTINYTCIDMYLFSYDIVWVMTREQDPYQRPETM